MNFIDRALQNHLRGDDFLQAMASIYHEPEVWDHLDKYPPFVRDVLLLIDYDTELMMGGLQEIIHGNLEGVSPEIIRALDRCGAVREAAVLRRAKEMPEEQYRAEYQSLTDELSLYNDYEGFWDLVRTYIDQSFQLP